MEKLFKAIFTTENLRVVVILVAIACGVVWLNSQAMERAAVQDEKIETLRNEMNALRNEVNAKIDTLRAEVSALKTNDIAHLYAAIEALTFTMVKNNTLTPADKEYIDSRLSSRP